MKTDQRPPRDNLYRAIFPGVELRAAGDGEAGDQPTMVGHFAVFNQWTEIDSCFEGRFLERFAPGAFKKTIRENRNGMRVLFNHGYDPTVGDKPLGPITELREDKEGAYYEVPLLDAGYVRDEVLPGLEAGLYGASFRFRVIVEEMNEKSKVSAHNPHGLPERTVKEASVREFGPVTFPAYDDASAGIRSLSDEFLLGRMAQEPERLKTLVAFIEKRDAPTPPDPAPDTDPEASEAVDVAAEAEDPEVEAPAADEPAGDAVEPDEPAAGDGDRAENVTAPSTDGAEAEPHADQEGRAKGEPLFGVPSNRAPGWRL